MNAIIMVAAVCGFFFFFLKISDWNEIRQAKQVGLQTA
jgi:hypothetical protein